ncbi:MAG: hypothetical protein QOF72_910 [Blastocatellia bacterium]|jgi:lipid-binding SYLF domain-containing protein|nr:hypothetical protein [Blastocatellia bacterium]
MKNLLTHIVVSLVGLALSVFPASAQKPTSEKFKHAIERSEDSARLLSLLAQPNSGLPSGLMAKARIVAVFPRASRQDALVRRFLQGYGVISSRQDSGWSSSAFYQFTSAPRKFSGSSDETLAVILFFLNEDALSWFEDGKSKFKGERAALLGPVNGPESKAQAPEAQIVAYTYYNGKLNASNVDPDFFRDFILDQDNNINEPLYGARGREVLAGRKVDSASLPSGISAFQEALQKYCPAR